MSDLPPETPDSTPEEPAADVGTPPPANAPAPGWYPDPTAPGQQRYWDGAAWTEHTAPVQQAAPAYGAAPGYAAAPVYGEPITGINPWLWQSIVACVLGLCTYFVGSMVAVPGIVFAAQANTAMRNGNRPEAERTARLAKIFTLISFGITALGIIVVIIFVIAAGAASSF